MPTIEATIGMFFGFLDADTGKLLVKRRLFEDPFRGNWDLPGGGVQTVDSATVRYDHPISEANREAEEEVGMHAVKDPMPAVYLVLFKASLGNYDLAGVIPYVTNEKPTKGEIMWVSPQELQALAQEFISEADAKRQGLSEAKGLVSGVGKRMHCMCLRALTFSPNRDYASDAQFMLAEIQTTW
jgi:8-oxo-dGTP pyrophosphatase MutT (NUDIX family)